MRTKGTVIILLFVFTTAVFAQERYVIPIDEAKMDASFVAFRKKLLTAVEGRDSRFILSIVDPKIRLSLGDAFGLADFKQMWKINDRNSKFWDEFRRVIKNGGMFFPPKGRPTKLFYAPYSFEAFPDDLDAFEHFVIFGRNVALREKPALNSRVIARLSYNVVKIDDSNSAASKSTDWHRIMTLGGKIGFVSSRYIRSPLDYRAGFEKKRGRWRIVAFIAGD